MIIVPSVDEKQNAPKFEKFPIKLMIAKYESMKVENESVKKKCTVCTECTA